MKKQNCEKTELKPCPFCGSDDIDVSCGKRFYVFCDGCHASYASWVSFTEKDAINKWNTRAYPRLKKAIKEIEEWVADEGNNDIVNGLEGAKDILYDHIPEAKYKQPDKGD